MRSFGVLAAGLALALGGSGAPLLAETPGAASGAPMQPGGWGPGGWQAGAHGPDAAAAATHGVSGPAHAYRRPTPGWRMPPAWLGPNYVVQDWRGWGLNEPGPGMRWVRYYDDAVLIDSYGRVVDARPDFGWERSPGRYAGGPGYGYPPAGPGYPPPPPPSVTRYQAGPNTYVTTTVVGAPPPVVVAPPAYGYGYGYAGGSVVTVTPGTVVTTTTTTTDYETVYKSVGVRQARRAWRRPVRRPSHVRCVTVPTCPVLGS